MREFDFGGRRLNVVAAKETAAWLHRMVNPNVSATFTLLESRRQLCGRQTLWVRGDETEYAKAFRGLVHDLSRAHLGRAYRRYRKLIPHFLTLEGDGEGKRFHVHAAFRSPDHVPIESFITSVHMHWTRSPWRMGNNLIEPITADWTGYALKEGSEALLLAGGF